jgi:L,D-transpeptidase catalytic domain
VDFVMRHQAVFLAAALAWLTGIESAEARLDILVDKATQRMLVIQNGYMRFIWPVSTGRDETATPSGVYTPQRLERNWFSSAYYNSPMPYSIFFHKGYAIHGSYAIDRLGGPASHGCVRLHPHHASLLFGLVQEEGPDKTTIEVADGARPDEPPLPEREIAAGRGVYPPVPEIVRYRETGEMPELPPAARRGNRPVAAKNPGPLRPPPPPPGRRMLSDARPPAASAPRPPCAAAGDTANGSPRSSDESSDCRPKPRVAEAPPPEQAQPAPTVYGFRLLPSSCWSGGATRWRWWSSSQGVPCK